MLAIQGSGSHTSRPTKRRRPDVAPTPALSPPQRRISTVLPQPPEHILESPQSPKPHSPQLSEPDIMPPEAQQESENQETYTLHLQPIDVNQPTTPQESTPPTQMSPHQQLTQTTPPPQPDPSFWGNWNQQQAQNLECLCTHTQYLASLPHHLPRLCRNTSRLNVQLRRVANSLEQMRADSQLIVTFQRIMDEQHRHQQALIQLIQTNQIISETMSRIIDNNTTATTQLTATLANLSQNINLLAQHQQGSSSGTTTPTQTPISSPVRRSSRTRSNVQTKPTSATKEQPKK
ncbi:uncharacterized protein LOC134969788 [Pseudophryne corroboree]|uniref:uncharacterized protein LOC134969788 n=1 Tax=Pseudophryne corroboree TaxID=495146 RepID=UPI0030814739